MYFGAKACRERWPGLVSSLYVRVKTSRISVYRLVQNDERFEIPTLVAVEPQPSHPSIRFLAKISPKPSITPFTKGKKRLIASEDANAISLVRVERDESNTERVAVGYE